LSTRCGIEASFCVKRRGYSYIGGFAPEFAQLGAGRLIMNAIIDQAAAEGATEFDFLRGQEDYKLRWGGKIVQQYRVALPMEKPAIQSRSVSNAAPPPQL